MTATLAPITRPDGRPFRPRVMNCHAVDGDGMLIAVIVFGTHDPAAAQTLASDSARYWGDATSLALNPVTGWWRDAICRGERTWSVDPVRGRAGVWFDVVDALDVADVAVSR